MLLVETKILKFSQYEKSGIAPFVIYSDLEFLMKKTDKCKNNPEKTSTKPSGFSMSKISSFKDKENKHDVCRGEACIKSFVNP